MLFLSIAPLSIRLGVSLNFYSYNDRFLFPNWAVSPLTISWILLLGSFSVKLFISNYFTPSILDSWLSFFDFTILFWSFISYGQFLLLFGQFLLSSYFLDLTLSYYSELFLSFMNPLSQSFLDWWIFLIEFFYSSCIVMLTWFLFITIDNSLFSLS